MKLLRVLNLNQVFLCLCLIIFFSCSHENEDNISVKPSVKILILGNSVLNHSPSPSLGWYGDWGMAATAPDKDFKSVYLKKLQNSQKFDLITLDSQNIAYWENDLSYALNNYIDISNRNYDILIVRLGENVGDLDNYESALNNMINHFKNINTKVLITGLIWENDPKEIIHQNVALLNKYYFISMANFRHDSRNYSWGNFENSAVAAHPSDFGMNSIAELLYTKTLQILPDK